MTHLTTRALRLYDQKGLLIPGYKDPISKYRYYTINQIEKELKIKMLVNIGFKLNEIPKLLNAAELGDTETLEDYFSRKLTETQLEIQRLRKIEEFLKTKENSLSLFYSRTTEPIIKEIQKMRIISLRRTGSYEVIKEPILELFNEILFPMNQNNHVKISGPIMLICYDKEYKESESDIEVAIPIQGKIQIQSEDIELKILPKGKVISVLYTGPYDEIHPAYTRIHKFCLENNLKIKNYCLELYLNNPENTPTKELLTEIQIPLEIEK